MLEIKTISCDTCQKTTKLVHKVCNSCLPLIPEFNKDNIAILDESVINLGKNTFSFTYPGILYENKFHIHFTRQYIFLFGDLPTDYPIIIQYTTEKLDDFLILLNYKDYFLQKVIHTKFITERQQDQIFHYLQQLAQTLAKNKIILTPTDY